MDDTLWAHRSPTLSGPGTTTLGRWEPSTAADVTSCRRRLAAALHDGAWAAGTSEGAVERTSA
jgi:hypothetical protein